MSPWPGLSDQPNNHGATSSGLSVLRDRASLTVIAVSGALSISGTSSAEPARVWAAPHVHEMNTTASGPGFVAPSQLPTPAPESSRIALSELRRISGLTWEQLGELFEVSRRSVHFWASGKPLNSSNEVRLIRVVDVIRDADRGDARSTRAALFDTSEGVAPFDLLTAQRFQDARAALGNGGRRQVAPLTELSAEARLSRRPPSPDTLVDAKSERAHQESGRARPARTVRNKRRERS